MTPLNLYYFSGDNRARVSLILAAHEATADALGDAIADTVALRILLACRHTDVRLTLGPAMAAEGWRPDRLHPASPDSTEDAGSGYVHAPGHRDPVLARFRALGTDEAATRALRRAAHRPGVDVASWNAAKAHWTVETTAVDGVDRVAVADVLAAFGDDERVWTVDLLARLVARSERYAGWGPEQLADLLRPLGVSGGQIKCGGRNRNGYHRGDVLDALR